MDSIFATNMRGINQTWILSSLLILWLLPSCRNQDKHQIQPTLGTISESVYASGYLKSQHQYQAFAKVNALIREVKIQEGDTVKKGQILFVLSDEVSRLSTDNARLLAENADFRNNQDKLQELGLAMELSKKRMDNDRLLFERQQNLWKQQIGTRLELEQRELASQSSASAYESARLRYQELKRQLDYSSRQAQKSLSISKAQWDDFQVRSEIDGRVYRVLREKGEMVGPQTPLAIMGASDDFKVILQVDENDIIHIKNGQRVVISMESYPGQLFEAGITKINPMMNERSRSFDVEAVFTKLPERCYPNLTIEANIILHQKEKVLTIPRQYLLEGDYVLRPGNKKQKVKVGLKDYQTVEILEGLQSQDYILLPETP